MVNESALNSTSIFKSEGLVLVLLTAMTYAAFLVREMGYVDYYSIPYDLVSATHIGLVSSAKALVWGAMAYVGKVNLVWIFAPRGERVLHRMLRYVIGIVLIVGFACYPYLATGLGWWWFGGAVAMIVFPWLVWPFLTQRSVPGFERKVVEQIQAESEIADIYGTLLDRFDRASRVTFFFILAMLVFAYGDGRRQALEQEEYNVVEAEPTMVLLRIYGDLAAYAAFDLKSHQLNGLVRLAKIPEGKGIEIRRTLIGRLKQAEIKK